MRVFKQYVSFWLLLLGCFVGVISGCSSNRGQTSAEQNVEAQDELIRRQDEERKRQERELEDLKRQKYHDDYIRSRYPQLGQ